MNKPLLYTGIAVASVGLLVGMFLLGMWYKDFTKENDDKNNNNSQTKNTPTPTPSPTASPTVTSTATPTTNPTVTGTTTPSVKNISIYMFDRAKYDTPNNTDVYTVVNRQTTRADVAAFAIEEIIKGPTAQEKLSNLDTTFGTNKFVWFTGNSNCNGKDFTVSISSDSIATVKFCKQTMLAGDLSGGIVSGQIEKTLKQFATIKKVRVLNSSGNCFDDMRGVSSDQCVD